MRILFRRVTIACIETVVVCLLGVASASGQTAPPEKPLMAEDVFKNVQVLKGIPVDQFMETMGFFSASLGYNCTDCHVSDSLVSWAKYADDIPVKLIARNMITMVNAFNKNSFGGRRVLTCYSCHRGAGKPKVIPSLAEQYGTPPDDPNEVEISNQDLNDGPTADQVLTKFIQAIGGAQKLTGLTSFAGKGTYEGYDTGFQKVPVEVFAKAPGQRALIAHGPLGDSSTIFDGRNGWVAGPDRPVPVLAIPAGAELEGLKLDAILSFPGGLKQALSQWRSGFPGVSINDREMDVIQGTTGARARVKLFFDKQSGLLTRLVRYDDTIVGVVPIQVDYSDYREVQGVKMPFKWTLTWTDGRSTTELSGVQANISIDQTKFGKPAQPVAPDPKPAAK